MAMMLLIGIEGLGIGVNVKMFRSFRMTEGRTPNQVKVKDNQTQLNYEMKGRVLVNTYSMYEKFPTLILEALHIVEKNLHHYRKSRSYIEANLIFWGPLHFHSSRFLVIYSRQDFIVPE